jgi:hypothetical protein
VEWQLDATATSWTGGGELWWSIDGAYVEDHVVRSREAAPDGSRDELRAVLAVESDWRDVTFGTSTAFACTDTPALRFVVYAANSDTAAVVTDCVFDGDPSVWDEQPDVPACDDPVPADTDAP